MIEALAIGRFDGLHLGHMELLKRLGENGAILLIDTKKSNLTPPHVFGRYVSLPVYRYELDAVKDLSAEEFVSKLKKEFFFLKRVVVGDDFRFAVHRSGDANTLSSLFDGETIVVPELKIGGIGVHSRYIRSLILGGKIKDAAKYIGREYEIFGRVVKGQGIGAQKLVATINVHVEQYILPKEGVYATKTELNGIQYPSVTFVGHRVSTDGNFAVETHILSDFEDSNIESVFVSFVEKIRDNSYFEDMKALKKAIDSDIEAAKSILGVV
jgi:riboflavin kinase/FMN adenylyltransferase